MYKLDTLLFGRWRLLESNYTRRLLFSNSLRQKSESEYEFRLYILFRKCGVQNVIWEVPKQCTKFGNFKH